MQLDSEDKRAYGLIAEKLLISQRWEKSIYVQRFDLKKLAELVENCLRLWKTNGESCPNVDSASHRMVIRLNVILQLSNLN
jgi:hypothetical protein